MNPHTKNQILAHLAEADRLTSGHPTTDTSLDILDGLLALIRKAQEL